MQLNATVKLTKTDEKTIRTILAGCMCFVLSLNDRADLSAVDKIHNCDVMIREDVCFTSYPWYSLLVLTANRLLPTNSSTF